jgi:hypothetical protein
MVTVTGILEPYGMLYVTPFASVNVLPPGTTPPDDGMRLGAMPPGRSGVLGSGIS